MADEEEYGTFLNRRPPTCAYCGSEHWKFVVCDELKAYRAANPKPVPVVPQPVFRVFTDKETAVRMRGEQTGEYSRVGNTYRLPRRESDYWRKDRPA
jgi:hypothetical protein